MVKIQQIRKIHFFNDDYKSYLMKAYQDEHDHNGKHAHGKTQMEAFLLVIPKVVIKFLLVGKDPFNENKFIFKVIAPLRNQKIKQKSLKT